MHHLGSYGATGSRTRETRETLFGFCAAAGRSLSPRRRRSTNPWRHMLFWLSLQ
jgi:hypothetical protein